MSNNVIRIELIREDGTREMFDKGIFLGIDSDDKGLEVQVTRVQISQMEFAGASMAMREELQQEINEALREHAKELIMGLREGFGMNGEEECKQTNINNVH